MIDLHSHTTASDGEHAPAELLRRAAAAGVKTLAVTDHDTVQGLAAAQAAASAHGVRLVPGIEISADLNGREIHVLGHFLDPASPHLLGLQTVMKKERRTRMERMVAQLAATGIAVTMEAVLAVAGEASIGRPHLARVLVQRGAAVSVKDAFDRFLGFGKPGYVERQRMSAGEAIELCRIAGGTATIAHPGVSKVSRAELGALAELGLAGVEANHADHVPSQAAAYARWAAELGLVATAGSDYHGETVSPGRKLGERSMTQTALDALQARRVKT